MTGYYGSADQQAMARKAEALFALVKGDPRFAWYGRNVVLTETGEGALDTFDHLVRLQGATAWYPVPGAEVGQLVEAIEGRGFRTDGFCFCRTAEEADSVALAEAVLDRVALPEDLTLTRLGPDSPDADLDALAEVALSCGVLPPPASVLRGEVRRSVLLLARDRAGMPVATAAAIESFHPDGPLGDTSWWGMLATVPKRRGEGIALRMGAEAMLTMSREHGFRRFMTGIRAENAPSLGLCAKLGVGPTGDEILIAMDPSAFSDARITK